MGLFPLCSVVHERRKATPAQSQVFIVIRMIALGRPYPYTNLQKQTEQQ